MTEITINIDPKWWWIPLGILLVYLWTAVATVAKNDWRNYSYRKPNEHQ